MMMFWTIEAPSSRVACQIAAAAMSRTRPSAVYTVSSGLIRVTVLVPSHGTPGMKIRPKT